MATATTDKTVAQTGFESFFIRVIWQGNLQNCVLRIWFWLGFWLRFWLRSAIFVCLTLPAALVSAFVFFATLDTAPHRSDLQNSNFEGVLPVPRRKVCLGLQPLQRLNLSPS